MFEPALLESAPPQTWLNIADEHFHTAVASDDLNRLLYLDVKMTLADNDLRKCSALLKWPVFVHASRCSITSWLSSRGASRAALKMRGFEKRFIFKEAMKEHPPAQRPLQEKTRIRRACGVVVFAGTRASNPSSQTS